MTTRRTRLVGVDPTKRRLVQERPDTVTSEIDGVIFSVTPEAFAKPYEGCAHKDVAVTVAQTIIRLAEIRPHLTCQAVEQMVAEQVVCACVVGAPQVPGSASEAA